MKRLLTGFLMTLPIAASAGSSPLLPYADHDRVLVMSAAAADDPEFRCQTAIVSKDVAGMTERDLVVIRIVGGTARDDRGTTLDAKAVRENLSLSADRFAAVLIGKDGGVKMRRDAAISAHDLFGTIDAMPMRRNEMRRGG